MGTPNPFDNNLPPRDPNHPWPPQWHLKYEVASGKPAFNFVVERDPFTDLPTADLKDPHFRDVTDSKIWAFKGQTIEAQLRDLVAIAMNMRDTVADMTLPPGNVTEAPGAIDALLKALQNAYDASSPVTNLTLPDDFREPEPIPPRQMEEQESK